jgi:hypothetical protein
MSAGDVQEVERRLLAERQRRELLSRGPQDLIFFAEHALRIRPKVGPLQPFVFNAAQNRLHEIIEKQKREMGRVRIVVLKARQLGVSTYVAARFLHQVINTPALRCYIVGHEKRASANLFQIVKRFYDHLPTDVKPPTSASSQDELLFQNLDSGYLVSTASLEGAGRSATSQLLHGSETAFWHDVAAQFASLIQTVPDLPGTEIIIETTANGHNEMYSLWRKAEAGESEFVPVFLPWSLDPAYRRDAGPDFEMTADERQLAELHGLDIEQIAWRRAKISQLGSAEYFQQEYPLTASEAFISPSHDSFIPAELVLKARREDVAAEGPLVLGVDPAGLGADRTAIAYRRGRVIERVVTHRGLDTMQIAGQVVKLIREEKPSRVYIDVGGLGAGIYDRLIELGHDRIVVGVNFGGKPHEHDVFGEDGRPAGGPANRRAELWLTMRKHLEAGRFKLPDSNSLQADLVSCGYKYDSAGRIVLESKQDMRRRGVPSPDEGDAVALTFAGPAGRVVQERKSEPRSLHYGYHRGGTWMGS